MDGLSSLLVGFLGYHRNKHLRGPQGGMRGGKRLDLRGVVVLGAPESQVLGPVREEAQLEVSRDRGGASVQGSCSTGKLGLLWLRHQASHSPSAPAWAPRGREPHARMPGVSPASQDSDGAARAQLNSLCSGDCVSGFTPCSASPALATDLLQV